MLSVFLRYTDSDYPFGIFKLFLCLHVYQKIVRLNNLRVFSSQQTKHKRPKHDIDSQLMAEGDFNND